eukprot:TRINITY_DN6503_c0_g1_i1.p1 TRINITY_DN6503_c0_g1~~TRINITY_DN6503_c0_g1_i1.p1  ORF type:complete len:630 (+),score=112.46 TRINITY_DN6503_c0_g1_i1:162-2051(+)
MAINVNRAARRTDEFLVATKTLETVGPGTYANTHNEVKQAVGEAIAPFSSLQEKVLNPNLGTSAFTPGPGAYTAKKPTEDDPIGLGCASLRSKVSRLGPSAPGSTVYTSSTIELNPGPDTYTLPRGDIDTIALPAKELTRPVKPVIEAQDKTTPSIPAQKLLPGQKPDNGSENDADMSALMMRHTGDRRDMVGPGEYDPDARHIVAPTAPATKFHASKLNRNLFEPGVGIENRTAPREIPGPGAYAKRIIEEKEEAATCQFASRTPLTYQVEPRQERIVPGPGRYECLGQIDRLTKSARERGEQMGFRMNFGTCVARNGWARDLDQPYTDAYHIHNVPGPGHYAGRDLFPDEKKKEAERALPQSARKKIHGVHHPSLILAIQEQVGPLQAFNSSDDRPCNKPVESFTPAPTDYAKEDARANSMDAVLKERMKIGRRGVFGTCADRFYGSPLYDARGYGEPGGDTGGDFGDSLGATGEPRAAFQSQTKRFEGTAGPQEVHVRKTDKFQTPAPGDYNIEKEANYRSPFRTARNDHLSFGSGETRFTEKRDIFHGHAPGLNNPGPADYEALASARSKPRGCAKMKARRPDPYVGSTNEKVGPGSYISTDTHMLKRTFNVSTQNYTPRRRAAA